MYSVRNYLALKKRPFAAFLKAFSTDFERGQERSTQHHLVNCTGHELSSKRLWMSFLVMIPIAQLKLAKAVSVAWVRVLNISIALSERPCFFKNAQLGARSLLNSKSRTNCLHRRLHESSLLLFL